MSSKDEKKMQKIKKLVPIPKKQQIKKDKNENLLLEYMGDVDDKLFKKYNNGKNFNSFINKFLCATNEEDKEKVVKELKDANDIINRDIFIMDEDSEYRSKLIDIANSIDYFLYEYSKKQASDFNWREAVKDY